MWRLTAYIVRQVAAIFAFGIVTLCLIFVVVNLIENLDDFLDTATPPAVIAEYYVLFLPEMLKYMAPIATLLACLFGIGRLSQRHEITAMKAAGMGLHQLVAPVVGGALLLSAAQLAFNGWLVPKANERKLAIERRYLQRSLRSGTLFQLAFRDNPTRTVLLQRYEPEYRRAYGVTVEEYTAERSPRWLRRIEAAEMYWDSVTRRWHLWRVTERMYNGSVYVRTFPETTVALRLTHETILHLQRTPAEMSLSELRQYITTLSAGGQEVRPLQVTYHSEYALPFAHTIVALIAVPLAAVYRRAGLAAQFGTAAVLAFVYMVFARVSQTVGAVTTFPPLAAGWFANSVFFLIGLGILWRTRT
ncbi:MAG: LptF/LptG family permease [Candidatus Kapabacteria bacterium]|nr:LptF/LptG family permease [Candidatus Kapabacteria bacterium]MCS7170005.1 LptF/LptG family permease [Candidatus Kapabacteria bacterium]MDW7996853.1 LptF/LptG family permease [Bacteroidota bacterium]MDW8225267.1 LptF/LptG family permease [Bacteroidota bacterium]